MSDWPWYLWLIWAVLSAGFIGGWAYYCLFESDIYERPFRDWLERRREWKRRQAEPQKIHDPEASFARAVAAKEAP